MTCQFHLARETKHFRNIPSQAMTRRMIYIRDIFGENHKISVLVDRYQMRHKMESLTCRARTQGCCSFKITTARRDPRIHRVTMASLHPEIINFPSRRLRAQLEGCGGTIKFS